MEGYSENLKWWQKTWVILLALIIFPPVGLVLLFLRIKRYTICKVIMAILGISFIVGIVGFIGNHSNKESANLTKQQETKEQINPSPDISGLTPDEQIITIATNALGSYKYTDVPVMVGEWSENQSLRFVSANMYLDSITESGMKNTFDSTAIKLFHDLYTRDLNVGKITLFGFTKTVDTYGNEKDSMVMRVSLNIGTADKINWENFRQRMLEKAADDYWIAPVMKKELYKKK